jgi:hypothetical protein
MKPARQQFSASHNGCDNTARNGYAKTVMSRMDVKRLCWWEVWFCVGILGWLVWCMVACATGDKQLIDAYKDGVQRGEVEAK